jgi:hypothetical protein
MYVLCMCGACDGGHVEELSRGVVQPAQPHQRQLRTLLCHEQGPRLDKIIDCRKESDYVDKEGAYAIIDG